MTRKRRFTKVEAGQKPAIRVGFHGKNINEYYSLLRIAREHFKMPQATLARQVLVDFVKSFRMAEGDGDLKRMERIQLKLFP
jgi:hypothetical protein